MMFGEAGKQNRVESEGIWADLRTVHHRGVQKSGPKAKEAVQGTRSPFNARYVSHQTVLCLLK